MTDSPLWRRVYRHGVTRHVAYQLSTESWVGVDTDTYTAVGLCESNGLALSMVNIGE